MALQISIVNRFLRFTPEGRTVIIISLAVGFAAVNTGNNLLYLVLAMLLSLIIASGFLSEWGIKGLTVKRTLPPYIFAHTPCSILLHVTNNKRYLPSFSLELEEEVDGENKGGLAYLFRVGARKTQTQVYRLSFPRRGIHRLRDPHLLTRFPFGFFIKGARTKETREVLAYPQLLPWEELLPEQAHGDERSRSRPQKGRGEDIFAVREYLPGISIGAARPNAPSLWSRNTRGRGQRRYILCLTRPCQKKLPLRTWPCLSKASPRQPLWHIISC
jgi:uncharacterized protein (DUF58 family)